MLPGGTWPWSGSQTSGEAVGGAGVGGVSGGGAPALNGSGNPAGAGSTAGTHGGDTAAPAARQAGSGSGTVQLGMLASMALSLPAPGSDPWLEAMVRNFVVSSAVSVTTAMALFMFGRRKQEQDEEEEKRRRAEGGQDGAGGEADQMLVTPWDGLPDESSLPRWRRPSLMAARRGAPVPTAEQEAATRLTFERGFVEPDAHHERRRIRYRMVRLSDAADEIRSNELGRLDRGDEVELLESLGAYWKVRVPTGQVGWVHRMTLGERIDATAVPAGGARRSGVAVAWGGLPTDDDEDGPSPDLDRPPQRDVFAARLAWQPAGVDEPAMEGLAAKLIRERHQQN